MTKQTITVSVRNFIDLARTMTRLLAYSSTSTTIIILIINDKPSAVSRDSNILRMARE